MMQIYFEIKEYLTVKNRLPEASYGVKDEVLAVMDYQLSLLGALMLRERGHIDELVLVADNERYTFSGNEVSAKLGELMKAMRTAKNVEIFMHYGFTAQGMNGMGIVAGPRNMLSFLDELAFYELDDILYCTWFRDGCENSAGAMFAFGNHEGVMYHGKVESETVGSTWFSQVAAHSVSSPSNFTSVRAGETYAASSRA